MPYIKKSFRLQDLKDVTVTSLTDGDYLKYIGASSKFENRANTIDNLNNVQISSPTNLQSLKYISAGATWRNSS